jgi:hypothetical protein
MAMLDIKLNCSAVAILLATSMSIMSRPAKVKASDVYVRTQNSYLDTLQWLQRHQESDDSAEIDYSRVIEYLRRNRQSRGISGRLTSHHPKRDPILASIDQSVILTDDIESDGEFPESEDDDEDHSAMGSSNEVTQFFDPDVSRSIRWAPGTDGDQRRGQGLGNTSRRKKHSTAESVMYSSSYGSSSAAMGSVMYYSAVAEVSDDRFASAGEHRRNDYVVTDYNTRLYLTGVMVEFADTLAPSATKFVRTLELLLSECILDVKAASRQLASRPEESSDSDMSMTQLHCSIARCSLVETITTAEENNETFRRCLVALDSSLQPGEISSGPAIDLSVVPGGAKFDIRVSLRPLLVSLHFDCLTYWTNVLSSVPIPATGETASVPLSLALSCRSANVVLHADTSHSKTKWSELVSALDLPNLYPSEDAFIPLPWRSVPQGREGDYCLFQLLAQSPGGILVTFHNIDVTKSADSQGNSDNSLSNEYTRILATQKVEGKLFLFDSSSGTYQETTFIEVFSQDSVGPGISLESASLSSPGNKESAFAECDGIQPPCVSGSSVLYVRANTIAIGNRLKLSCNVSCR